MPISAGSSCRRPTMLGEVLAAVVEPDDSSTAIQRQRRRISAESDRRRGVAEVKETEVEVYGSAAHVGGGTLVSLDLM